MPAAAEAGDLARRVQAREDLAAGAQHPAGQVGLQAAEGLAGEQVEPDGDQRAGVGVEQPVRRRDPDQLVAEVVAGPAERGDLQVLGERVLDLAVAGDDLALDLGEVELGRAAGDPVHPGHQLGQRRSRRRSPRPRSRNACTGRGDPGLDPVEQQLDVLAGEVGVLLGAGERELLLHDLVRGDEPGVLVARRPDVRRACPACRSRGTAGPAAACRSRRATSTTARGGSGCRAVPRPASGWRCPPCSATSGRC